LEPVGTELALAAEIPPALGLRLWAVAVAESAATLQAMSLVNLVAAVVVLA
jgi:hypothetical protein